MGRVETLHDLPTYISDPPNGAEARAIVVILPDAFGWEFTNTRLLADRYAQRLQMRVLVPEFMDGESSGLSHYTKTQNAGLYLYIGWSRTITDLRSA